ncbi:hypothetical protein SOVF_118070 [Spinacia oleracea]|uniref:Pentatricopeptide repeat-containing protein At3g49142 n=1 Tax=Spinacia oleracea TaxID=3562 RepID=A0ABM3RFF9_SPIOL|nr:putative pentatricopeptide repeat-containing protein At3g49142 [Spinacia oleracea]KNA13286.1 hypothetical protein SOVF_118070 [Spinacia oleracea]
MIIRRNSFFRNLSTANQLKPNFPPIQNPKFTRQNVLLPEETCNQILDSHPDLKTLKQLHANILTHHNLHSSSSIRLKLIRAYAGFRLLGVARQLFDEIPERNVIFFNVMIRSYVTHQQYQDALLVYKSMSSVAVRPDHYTYPCALKACSGSGNSWVGRQIHAAVSKIGLNLNLYVENGLVSMYGKCDCLMDARKVLDEMPVKDVVSWNSMVSGYAQKGRFDDALNICREMESVKLNADAGTMASLLPAVTNTSSENIIFVKSMFEKMVKKSLVSWNVMIAMYVNNSMAEKAIDVYSQMEANGIEADTVTFTSILPACGDLSAFSLGSNIHKHAKRKKLLPNLAFENALINMYAKCGCLKEAREVFDTMLIRDIVSWSSMISAYGVSGQGNEAVSLFSRMREEEGLIPDSIAFVAVMSACSHAGMSEEGEHYYKLMTENYNITPRLEHYCCMVDLLGRAGKVDEALTFIKEMTVESNERVWGALLGACCVHSNMNIGLIAAEHLFRMVPEQCGIGYYVLLSNIYAKAGKWKEVSTIRSSMKNKGMNKTPGISNVEHDGQVYTFLAGDRSHPQTKEIYDKLHVLLGKMKEEGYVPEMDFALHDVEEEDKEGHLRVHSEKLAIMFALINTKPPTPIRITKNLRICGDCHVAIKLISKITKREIIVRDTNRFHTFNSGGCSCGDYW